MKLLKLISLAFLLTAFITCNSIAQEDAFEGSGFEESPNFQEKSKTYFIIGGGPILNMLKFNYDPLNDLPLSDMGFNKQFDGFLYQFGAEGLITVGVIPKLRFGVIGLSGSKTIDEAPISGEIAGIKVERDFEVRTHSTGFAFDYAFIPFDNFKFAILPSLTIGRGGMDVKYFQAAKNSSWNDFSNGSDSISFYNKIESSFWFASPALNLEYSPNLVSLFRASVGYKLVNMGDIYFNKEWTRNELTEVKKVPDGLSASGFYLQFGVFLGLFNY